MQLYFKVLAHLVVLLVLCFVCPVLISSKSTLLVILGFLSPVIIVPFVFWSLLKCVGIKNENNR